MTSANIFIQELMWEMYSNESSKLKISTDTVAEGAQRAATEANTY